MQKCSWHCTHQCIRSVLCNWPLLLLLPHGSHGKWWEEVFLGGWARLWLTLGNFLLKKASRVYCFVCCSLSQSISWEQVIGSKLTQTHLSYWHNSSHNMHLPQDDSTVQTAVLFCTKLTSDFMDFNLSKTISTTNSAIMKHCYWKQGYRKH